MPEEDIPDAFDPYLAYSMGLSPESETVFKKQKTEDSPTLDKDSPVFQTGPNMPGADGIAGDREADAEKRLQNIEEDIARIRADQRLPDPFAAIFVASATALSGGMISWVEDVIVSADYQKFSGGRSGLLADGWGAKPLNATDFVSVGQRVVMLESIDPATNKLDRHFVAGGGDTVFCYLTTANSGGATNSYNAQEIPVSTASVSTSGTPTGTDDCIFLNAAEEFSGAPSWPLLSAENALAFGPNPRVMGQLVGMTTDTPPKKIVRGSQLWGACVACADTDAAMDDGGCNASGSDGSV